MSLLQQRCVCRIGRNDKRKHVEVINIFQFSVHQGPLPADRRHAHKKANAHQPAGAGWRPLLLLRWRWGWGCLAASAAGLPVIIVSCVRSDAKAAALGPSEVVLQPDKRAGAAGDRN